MKTFMSISLFLVLIVVSSTQIEAVKDITKPIIADTWVSHRGAEYTFVVNTMVCTYIPKELADHFHKWKGVTRLKNIKKVKDEIAKFKENYIDGDGKFREELNKIYKSIKKI